MPRFVILEHDHPARHWDFMLEAGDALRTWRLDGPPEAGRPVTAEASFDHRLLYLDYEGPIRGDRGQVKRWDAGTFTWVEDSTERLAAQLMGQRCRGMVIIEGGTLSLESI